jgi:myo-inositol-1(or 4)-monophosphatase
MVQGTARKAVSRASAILLEGMTRKIHVSFKGRINLLTEIDLASEQSIIDTISADFPNHGFLAEESGATRPGDDQENRWIIDPLDGTTNYAHRYPFFSISLAFESEGVIHYGMVFDPLRDQAFEAIRNRGAMLNGTPISVSPESDPGRSLLATGFSYSHADTPRLLNMRTFEGFSKQCQGIRRSGSAALDLCHVAMGVLDGFWEMSLSPWDTAAASLIVGEAGGRITDGKGKLFRLDSPIIVASNRKIHRWMLGTIRQCAEEPGRK